MIYIDKTVYKGRPPEKRIPKEERVYDLLDSLGIEFTRVDHEAVPTVEETLEIKKLLEIGICKNLFLSTANRKNFYLLVLPGEKKFKTSVVAKQIGSSRLSFAEESYMLEFLDITPGSVSVLGLMNDKENRVQLLVDKDMLTKEYYGCHPCINTSSLKFRTSDLFDKILPAIGHQPVFVELPEAVEA